MQEMREAIYWADRALKSYSSLRQCVDNFNPRKRLYVVHGSRKIYCAIRAFEKTTSCIDANCENKTLETLQKLFPFIHEYATEARKKYRVCEYSGKTR